MPNYGTNKKKNKMQQDVTERQLPEILLLIKQEGI